MIKHSKISWRDGILTPIRNPIGTPRHSRHQWSSLFHQLRINRSDKEILTRVAVLPIPEKCLFNNVSSLTVATTFAKYFDKLSKKTPSLSSHLIENSCYEINLEHSGHVAGFSLSLLLLVKPANPLVKTSQLWARCVYKRTSDITKHLEERSQSRIDPQAPKWQRTEKGRSQSPTKTRKPGMKSWKQYPLTSFGQILLSEILFFKKVVKEFSIVIIIFFNFDQNEVLK